MTHIEQIRALIAAGEKCTKLDLTSCESFDDDETCECPLCDGDGYVATATYMNIDNVPLNVQFSGIGPEHDNWHTFVIKAANARPALQSLLDENERLRGQIEAEAICYDSLMWTNQKQAAQIKVLRDQLEKAIYGGNINPSLCDEILEQTEEHDE